MKQKETHTPRTMRVVRYWDLDHSGGFTYVAVYSDGETRPSNRKEAEQYERAYETQVTTVVGSPERN